MEIFIMNFIFIINYIPKQPQIQKEVILVHMKKDRNNYTIGIEEEFFIISKDNYNLAPEIKRLLKNKSLKNASYCSDMFCSQIETKTKVCKSDKEAIENQLFLREQIKDSIPSDLNVLAMGIYPKSDFSEILQNKRNIEVHDELRYSVKRLNTCGIHFHIGLNNNDLSIRIMNIAKQYLPILLALSSNSAIYKSEITGFSSYRAIMFLEVIRSGIPPTFDSFDNYIEYINLLRISKFKTSFSDKTWWDLRFNSKYSTIEFRISDTSNSIDINYYLLKFICIIINFIKVSLEKNKSFSFTPDYIINENRWRAAKDGVNAVFIDYENKSQISLIEAIEAAMKDFKKTLGDNDEINFLSRNLKKIIIMNGAQYQLNFLKENPIDELVKDYSKNFLNNSFLYEQ
jgi:glutamate---cysteine ligase / carboxylate-amine ligase